MNPASSASFSPSDSQRNEVSGRLTINDDRKTGVYGEYWNVTITPEDELPPIQGTLSEKVWAKTGLSSPDSATHVKATAKRNSNGRWNVVSVDAGPKELKEVLATFVQLEPADQKVVTEKSGQIDKSGSATGRSAAYQFRLRHEGSGVFETRVPRYVLEKRFGILSLPLNYTLISDWSREPWGWKLEHISDQSLLSFFSRQDNETPTATGHPATAWRFDDGIKDLIVDFDTDIAGLSLRCKLQAYSLRVAGVRVLSANDLVKAHLSSRGGRWRLAELSEPRPDITAQSKGETLYAVETRFAFQEQNNSGELVDWLEIQDDRLDIGVTHLEHTKLVEIEEGALTPGAHIVCDLKWGLKKGKKGWYASRIHRVADQKMAERSRVW